MQATSTARRLQDHRIWLAAIIVALLGVLAAGAAMTITRDDVSPATVKARPVIESKTIDNDRFAEMNAFPDASADRLRTVDRQRFIEINRLPDASPAPVVSFEKMRFNEINALPGDDASLVAPSSDQLGERH